MAVKSNSVRPNRKKKNLAVRSSIFLLELNVKELPKELDPAELF